MKTEKETMEFYRNLRLTNERGYLSTLLNPHLEALYKVQEDSFCDFDLMTDEERLERIKVVLKRELKLTEIITGTRLREQVEYRYLLAYLLSKYTKFSTPYIGYIMGGKDHATAIHGRNKIMGYVEFDRDYARKVEHIESEL
jgi:hypothetical protein